MKKTLFVSLLLLLSFPALARITQITPGITMGNNVSKTEVTPAGSTTAETLTALIGRLDPRFTSKPITVIAHRGFMTNQPQNTLRAYKYAIATGADSIEGDIQISSDGTPYMFHDDTVDSLTDCTGTFVELTASAIDACHYDNVGIDLTFISASDLTIPTLASVATLIKNNRTKASLEIKAYRTTADVATMVGAITTAGINDLVTWQSFSMTILGLVRAADPTASIALLASTATGLTGYIDTLAGWGNASVYVDSSVLSANPTLISYANTRGVGVTAWTITSATEANTMAALGVSSLISNIPLTKNALSVNTAYPIISGVYNSQPNSTSMAIGTAALPYYTGSYATGMGNESMTNVTTAIGATAFGYQAMLGATATPLTGTGNAAFGAFSLASIIGAANANTGAGYRAGQYITTGARNTAIGTDALLSNSSTYITLNDNTGVGYTALTALAGSNSYASTAVGSYAGASTTTHDQAFLGYAAGRYVTTGAGNTAIGAQSLLGASATKTTGGYNTGVGFYSLKGVIGAGAYNTALGANAGLVVTTGTNNVLIGPDVAKTTLTTGSNNILIGTSSLIDTTASNTSNTLNIGGAITGTELGTNNVITTTGGRVHKLLEVTASGDITQAASDEIICVNKTVGAATTVNLMASPETGRVVNVLDCKGDANSNNITVDPNGETTINGASTYVINTAYGSIRAYYNGTQWIAK